MHEPVLLTETLQMLNLKTTGVYVDCTVGHGGHSFGIIQQLNKEATLIIIDQDRTNLQIAKQRLAQFPGRLVSCYANFGQLGQLLKKHQITKVDGFLYDLGFAASQVYDPQRGFSYQQAGPLDMRMDAQQPLTAATIVNTYSLAQLRTILQDYGEEPAAVRIATAIITARQKQPLTTTQQLVQIIKTTQLATTYQSRTHPARKTFQALRIAVNNELNALQLSLQQIWPFKRTGTRVVVLTYHSLEDRIIKTFFQHQSAARIITKKPLIPSTSEIKRNYQARSAKLRVLEYV